MAEQRNCEEAVNTQLASVGTGDADWRLSEDVPGLIAIGLNST